MSLARDWVESIARPDTRANRAAVLNRIANYLNPGSTYETFDWVSVSRSDAENLKRHFVSAGMMPTTVRFQLATLRSVLRYYVEEGAMSQDALARVRSVKLPLNPSVGHAGRALNRTETGRIFSLPAETPRDRMDMAVFALLITTGMRASELCSLRLSQLQPTGIIRFTGKGQKVRNTWIEGPVNFHLDLHRQDCDEGQDWLVQNVISKPQQLSRFVVRDSLRRLSKRAEVVIFTPHDCRRTVATILLDEGVDVFVVSDLLGHSSMEVTQLYDRRPDTKKRAALQKLRDYIEEEA